MRVLAVDERIAARGLAGCKQIRVSAITHQRVERQHRAQLQPRAVAERAAPLDHRHRRDERLVVPARAALIRIDAPGIAMDHHHPLAGHEVETVHHRATRLARCARARR